MPPQNVYAKLLLLSAGRGYPLWTPEPSNELLMQRPEGLAIGDVGVVLDDGGFDVFFNICLSPDHPFHLRHGVPQGFNCIHPSELDIRTIVDAEPPGHIISSSSIMRQTFGSSSDVSKRHDLDTLPYVFNLSSSEGALLVLPKGAERCDLLNEDLFLEQATQHAADWYNYAVNRRRRIINPDSLYLITGIHKTSAWSVAAFENATGNDHTAHFKQVEGNDAPIYRWETTTCALDWRVGPRINYAIPNQSVFIRGFKVAIRSGFLGTRRVRVKADVPSIRSDHMKWKCVTPRNSSIRGGLTGFMGLFSSSTGNNIFPTSMRSGVTVNTPEERSQSGNGGFDGAQVEIQRIPGVPFKLHPSDAINQYLLEKTPSANIAITHDSHWILILEDGFENESSLETAVSQNYHMVSREGVVYLERRCQQPTDRPTIERIPETATKLQSSASHAHDLKDVSNPLVRDNEVGSALDDGIDIEDGDDVWDQGVFDKSFCMNILSPTQPPVSFPINNNHPSGFNTTQSSELPEHALRTSSSSRHDIEQTIQAHTKPLYIHKCISDSSFAFPTSVQFPEPFSFTSCGDVTPQNPHTSSSSTKARRYVNHVPSLTFSGNSSPEDLPKTPSDVSPIDTLGGMKQLSDPVQFSISPTSISLETAEYLLSARLTTLLKLTRYPHASIDHPLTVSLADLGDPNGFPLVVFLGLGCARHIMGLYDEMADCLGLRLIAIDRWGVGRTEVPQSKSARGIMEWASVVEEALDQLQIFECSIMAHSAGAPYALSFANRVPERIRGDLCLLAPWISGGSNWLKYVPDGILKTTQAAEREIREIAYTVPPTPSKPDDSQPDNITDFDSFPPAEPSSVYPSKSYSVRRRRPPAVGMVHHFGVGKKLKTVQSIGSLKGRANANKSKVDEANLSSPYLFQPISVDVGSGLGDLGWGNQPASPVYHAVTPSPKDVLVLGKPMNSTRSNINKSNIKSPLPRHLRRGTTSFSASSAAVLGSGSPSVPSSSSNSILSSPYSGVITTTSNSYQAAHRNALIAASLAEASKGTLHIDDRPWGFSYTDYPHKVRVWYGDRDEKVTENAVGWMERTMGEDRCDVQVVKGADHTLMFNNSVVVEVLERVREFW